MPDEILDKALCLWTKYVTPYDFIFVNKDIDVKLKPAELLEVEFRGCVIISEVHTNQEEKLD